MRRSRLEILASLLAFVVVVHAARAFKKDVQPTGPATPAVDPEQDFLDHKAAHREQSHVWLTSMLYALVLALAVAVGRNVVVAAVDSGKHHLLIHISLLIALGVVFAEVILIYSEVMFGVRFLRGIAGAAEVVLPALVGVAQAAQVELIDIAAARHGGSSTGPELWLLGFGAFALLASANITLMKRAVLASPLPSWTGAALETYARGLVVDRRSARGAGIGASLVSGIFARWQNADLLVCASAALLAVLAITVYKQACRRQAILWQLRVGAAADGASGTR